MSSKIDRIHQDKSHFSGVALWSIPRSGSTVVERSIRELDDVSVFHEPHQFAFYYGPERIYPHTVYRKDGSAKTEPTATFDAARAEIISEVELCLKSSRHFFFKDMALYVRGNYTMYTQGVFEHFKHTFLICHPMKLIHSRLKYLPAAGSNWPTKPFWMGFKEAYHMYETVKDTIDPTPLVIDHDDMFQHPREMLNMYCNVTGLPFSEDMLTWEPKVFPRWKQCQGYEIYHGEVIASSGFKKYSPWRSNTLQLEDIPPAYQEALEDALPFYEKLHSVRTLPA